MAVARKSLQQRSPSGIFRDTKLCVPCAEFGVCSAQRESPASGRTEVSPPFTGCSPALFAWPPRDGIQRRLDKRNSLVFQDMRLPVPAGQVQNTAVLQNTCLPAAAPQAHNSQVKFTGGCRQSATMMMTPMGTVIGETGARTLMMRKRKGTCS